MRAAFENLLRLQPQNMITEVWVAMALIWAALLAVAFMSILSQPISQGQKWFWSSVIILLPLAGLTLYSFSCLTHLDYRTLLGFLKTRQPELGQKPGSL